MCRYMCSCAISWICFCDLHTSKETNFFFIYSFFYFFLSCLFSSFLINSTFIFPTLFFLSLISLPPIKQNYFKITWRQGISCCVYFVLKTVWRQLWLLYISKDNKEGLKYGMGKPRNIFARIPGFTILDFWQVSPKQTSALISLQYPATRLISTTLWPSILNKVCYFHIFLDILQTFTHANI